MQMPGVVCFMHLPSIFKYISGGKNMKKLLSLLLVAAMGLSLVGCGGSDNGSKSESKSDLEYVSHGT